MSHDSQSDNQTATLEQKCGLFQRLYSAASIQVEGQMCFAL